MVATAYDPGPGSCGKYADGITCSGKRAGYGIAAVDPTIIPLGSKLYIEGYGYAIAADVGIDVRGDGAVITCRLHAGQSFELVVADGFVDLENVGLADLVLHHVLVHANDRLLAAFDRLLILVR